MFDIKKHVTYRTFNNVRLLIKPNEELPFTRSPIRLHMRICNISVAMTSLTFSAIKETVAPKNKVLTSLSSWLDWTDLLGLGLEKNFLGTSYKFIILTPIKQGDAKSICHLIMTKCKLYIKDVVSSSFI